MGDQAISPATMELLAWLALRRRTYVEVMDAWRSTCPRHSVWEDAVIDGLVAIRSGVGGRNEAQVTLTARGRAVLGA